MNLEILVRELSGNPLLDDLLAGDDRLAPFFPGHPHDPDAYRRKAEEVMRRFTPERRTAVSDAVRPTAAARERLRAITDGNGFFVTTGQQPGLFGGPLYTIHKALAAIALATGLETLLDRPVLALFWIASDDHDWAEANHTFLLDPSNTLHRVELAGDPGLRASMARRPVEPAALEAALSQITQLLPPSDFTPALLDQLREAYEGTTVAGGFGRLLEALFTDLPLAFTDAAAPAVRLAGLEVIGRELERTAEHERALAWQTSRLEGTGHGAQVPVLPGAANVFYEDDRGRERLIRADGGWLLRATKRRLDDRELRRLLDAEPARFSANVVLRPVVESHVFPTLAYVGGPGEVSYLAQTGCLFAAHGVGMPLVFPRPGVTLVEAKVRKVLEKFGLEVAAFGRPIHELVSEVVRDEVPAGVSEAIGRLRGSLQAGYEALSDAAQVVDPTLEGPIFQARNDAFGGLEDVERKVKQHLKSRNETGLEQLEKAAVNLAPAGKPQERVLNVHQYLARYGPDLLPAILGAMEIRLDGTAEGWNGVICDP